MKNVDFSRWSFDRHLFKNSKLLKEKWISSKPLITSADAINNALHYYNNYNRK